MHPNQATNPPKHSNNSQVLTSLQEPPAASTEKIITLNFRSSHPEEDDGVNYQESDEKEFYVFTVPFFKGARYSLIEWFCQPCGIQLAGHAVDELLDFSEEIGNPWCADIAPAGARFYAPAELLTKFRDKFTEVFEDSGSWKNLDGSKFVGEINRERVYY